MNTFMCPDEETLTRYLDGCMDDEERTSVETHLASCENCRDLVTETYKVSKTARATDGFKIFLRGIKKNVFPIIFFASIGGSFACPRYFLQFLLLGGMAGIKWITDARTAKTLIMIYDAWKKGDRASGGRHEKNPFRWSSKP